LRSIVVVSGLPKSTTITTLLHAQKTAARACQIVILEAVHAAVTVLLLSWTVFILDVNSKPKKLFSQIVSKPEHCLHYLLPTAREPSVTGRLRSANKLPRIFAKTNRFKNSFICYSLNSLQRECCFFYYLSDCNAAFELPYNHD